MVLQTMQNIVKRMQKTFPSVPKTIEMIFFPSQEITFERYFFNF